MNRDLIRSSQGASRFDIFIRVCLAITGIALLGAGVAHNHAVRDRIAAEQKYESLWAQSESQNSCLKIAYQSLATGNQEKANAFLVGAWESQYDSLPCEE